MWEDREVEELPDLVEFHRGVSAGRVRRASCDDRLRLAETADAAAAGGELSVARHAREVDGVEVGGVQQDARVAARDHRRVQHDRREAARRLAGAPQQQRAEERRARGEDRLVARQRVVPGGAVAVEQQSRVGVGARLQQRAQVCGERARRAEDVGEAAGERRVHVAVHLAGVEVSQQGGEDGRRDAGAGRRRQRHHDVRTCGRACQQVPKERAADAEQRAVRREADAGEDEVDVGAVGAPAQLPEVLAGGGRVRPRHRRVQRQLAQHLRRLVVAHQRPHLAGAPRRHQLARRPSVVRAPALAAHARQLAAQRREPVLLLALDGRRDDDDVGAGQQRCRVAREARRTLWWTDARRTLQRRRRRVCTHHC